MRVLHTEASRGWGGQEIRILRESQGLRERGHTLFFAVEAGGGLVARAREARFPVLELRYAKAHWPLTLLRLIRFIRRNRIELVVTHSSLDGWVGGLAARLAGVRVIRVRHLSTPIRPGLNSRVLYGKLADFVITTCADVVPRIVAQSERDPATCRSIPTGVEPFTVPAVETLVYRKQWGEAHFIVGMACMMRSWKGIDDFLEAAHSLRHLPDLKWVIIGGGHEERYRRRAAELKLEGIVHFTGHLDNPFPAIAALDSFALLSTAHEGVSQAILQAAYLRRPLIATPIGGLPEVCRHEETGLLVAPRSPEQVAAAVLKMKRDPTLRNKWGDAARKLVEREFLFSKTLDQMEAVMRGLSY